jgi:peptide/nickel transport system substrate-binding protein
MRKKLGGLVATAAMLFAACGGTATAVPATPPPASTTPGSAVPSAVASPVASLSPLDQQLFGTTFKPPTGTVPGGTLVMGEWQPPDNLNPFYSTALTTVEAYSPALRALTTLTADGKYIPDLASSVPTVDNGGVVISGTTYTVAVTLRSGLQWSDGTPVTMNDWKATWQFANDPAQSGCQICTIGYPDISSIDVSADGLTGTFHYKDLFPGWLAMLTNPFFQQKWLSTLVVAKASTSMPVSSAITSVPFNGPFMITNASKTEIDYAPNPNWHGGVDLAVGGAAHAPYLAGLKFSYFDTKDGEIAAFKSGAIDLALDLQTADYSTVSSTDPTVGAGTIVPGWEYEHLDLNNDPTKARGNGLWMPDVRKAIAMSINKPDLIAAIFPGTTVAPGCSPTPPGLWFAKTETCPAFDVTAANALLDPIMPVGSDGNRQLTAGKDVNLELCTTAGNPTRLVELQKTQSYLAAIHIKSTVKTADAGSVVFAGWTDTTPTTDCSLYRDNFDIGDFAYVLSADPYGDYFATYSTTAWPVKGNHNGGNDTQFSDPAMDAALTSLSSDADMTKQATDAGAVQDAYVGGTPEIVLYYRQDVTGIGVHVGGWPGYNPSNAGPNWNPEDWFYKP